MQLLLSQKKKLIFSLKKRSWKQVLHNRATEHCVAAQNDEIYVGAMLFWSLTVKVKNILFIQRDKLRADRATTNGMLGM